MADKSSVTSSNVVTEEQVDSTALSIVKAAHQRELGKITSAAFLSFTIDELKRLGVVIRKGKLPG